MQAVIKHKRRGSSGNKEAADDPNYENITFTFKNQNQPKGSHSPPNNKVPAESRPPSDTAQEHHWLPKAMMSLNTFLTLSCMVLLVLVLVKNFEVSRELVVLKEVLWKVQGYQEEQKTQWATVKQNITAAKQSLDTIKRSIQEGNLKQRQLATVEFHGHARPPAAALRNRLARPAHTPVPSLRLRTPPFTAP
nr:mast cell-expressed membrane protein 1 [Odocoileus virginianus texanus]